jgi:hypothetical protein
MARHFSRFHAPFASQIHSMRISVRPTQASKARHFAAGKPEQHSLNGEYLDRPSVPRRRAGAIAVLSDARNMIDLGG